MNGNYAIPNDFRFSPRYELRFENKYGFKEGHGLESLVLPSTYNMKNRKNLIITRNIDNGQKWWALATINNAAYDWFKFCEDNKLTAPPKDLRIWSLPIGSGAATTMFNHGLFKHTAAANLSALCDFFLTGTTIRKIVLSTLLDLIGPYIVICNTDSKSDSYSIYEPICHELAHASHFQQLGKTDFSRYAWWADVFDYEFRCILESGAPYGNASSSGNGPCGVTEMWAYTMGYYLSDTTYSGCRLDFPGKKEKYWFKPDALWELIIYGNITCQQAANCLKPEIKSVDDFVNRLISNNPTKKNIIKYLYYDKY